MGGQFIVSRPSSHCVDNEAGPHDESAEAAPSKELPGEEGRHVSEQLEAKACSFVNDLVFGDCLESDGAHEDEGQ